MYTFVMIQNTRRRSLCKPLEIEFNNNFFLCKLLRAITICKIGGTLHGRTINAEFSLQSASHNSRQNIQGQSWSQIREI